MDAPIPRYCLPHEGTTTWVCRLGRGPNSNRGAKCFARSAREDLANRIRALATNPQRLPARGKMLDGAIAQWFLGSPAHTLRSRRRSARFGRIDVVAACPNLRPSHRFSKIRKVKIRNDVGGDRASCARQSASAERRAAEFKRNPASESAWLGQVGDRLLIPSPCCRSSVYEARRDRGGPRRRRV
jgi:hypothetical protein